MLRNLTLATLCATSLILAAQSEAGATVYLNENTPITVAVGANSTFTTSNNTFANGATINKVIDAPSATATEVHDQSTHLWFTGGSLELLFDFQQEFNISTLHFWNYTSESFDVDDVGFTFFDGSHTQVGMLSVQPDLGSSPGISAQDIPLAAPLNVRFVTAVLTGTNGEVDFQNIGFAAEVSQPAAVPLPAALPLFGTGLGALGLLGWRKKRKTAALAAEEIN